MLIALKLPFEGGTQSSSLPQHWMPPSTSAPQVSLAPALTSVKKTAGGLDCPSELLPQHSTRKSVPSAHVCTSPAETIWNSDWVLAQSVGQESDVSESLQVPSPQDAGQAEQSEGQVAQSSEALQVPSPQDAGQAKQSEGQVAQSSEALQVPSPQDVGQAEQSEGQNAQSSEALQVPSPQTPRPGPVPPSHPTKATAKHTVRKNERTA